MKSRIWMIGLLVIMAIVCSSALSFVNYKTAPIIQKNREITQMRRVLEVFGIPYDINNSDGIIAQYKQHIEEQEVQEIQLFYEKESDATAVSLSGGGFQGLISLIVALDGDTISGFKIVSHKETPGLGARITEESFQNSFIGKRVSEGISMRKLGEAGAEEFNAITGATETSRALEKLLNRGFKRYFQVVKSKGNK